MARGVGGVAVDVPQPPFALFGAQSAGYDDVVFADRWTMFGHKSLESVGYVVEQQHRFGQQVRHRMVHCVDTVEAGAENGYQGIICRRVAHGGGSRPFARAALSCT